MTSRRICKALLAASLGLSTFGVSIAAVQIASGGMTVTSVSISPNPVGLFSSTTATITVSNADLGATMAAPSGIAQITSTESTDGSWNCTLAPASTAGAAACAVTIIPTTLSTRSIAASYSGDATHLASQSSTNLMVVGTSQVPYTITLTPTSSPTAGQPGVQPISLLGSGFPGGTIDPTAVTVLLTPVNPASVPSVTTRATRVTTVLGSTRRVTFTIPETLSVGVPTSYQVRFAGTATTGAAFQTGNASLVVVNPAATLVGINPSAAVPGAVSHVTLDAQNTNFVQGSTQASFGPGISVSGAPPSALGQVTVVSPTQAVADITVATDAVIGPRVVQVQTGLQKASKANAFSVLGSCVATPSGLVGWWSGEGNATDIAGGNNGTLGNEVSFATGQVGQGFSFSGVTFGSPGSIITVPDANALDLSTVTLESWILLNQSPSPNGDWVIATKGVTTTSENYGLYVRDIDGHGTLELLFSLYDPNFTGVSPRVIPQSGFVWVLSNGAGLTLHTLHHVAATADGSFINFYVDGRFVSREVQPGPLRINSFPLQIGSAAPFYGNRFNGVIDELSVYNRGLAADEIQAIYSAGSAGKCTGTPALTSVLPADGRQGQQNLSVTVTGKLTHFTQGITTVGFGAGITVNSITVANATSLTADISLASNASLGGRTVTVTTGSEVVSRFSGFTVLVGNQPPVVSAGPSQTVLLPGRIVAGHDVNTLGTSYAGPNENQFAVNLAKWLTGGTSGKILAVESTPGDGTRDYAASVKAALASSGFTVTYVSNAATVSALALADLQTYKAVFVGETWPTQASISSSVLTQYVNGGGNVYVFGGVGGILAEAALLNPFLSAFGLAFDTVSYNGLLSVNVTSAHPIFDGLTGKILQSGIGQDIHDLGTNPNASIIQFQGLHGVYAIVDPPAISVSLNGSFQDDGLPIGTNLSASWSEFSGPVGAGAVKFAPATFVVPNVAGVANPAVTTASFDRAGTYVLRLTANDSQLSASSDVTILVNPAQTPTLVSVSPNAGGQGQMNLSVVITGQATHFVQGTTTVSFGSGIAVNGTTVVSGTSLTANITIAATATLGARSVTVTSGTETVSLASGFTVQPGTPTILSIDPNTGYPGQQPLGPVGSIFLTGHDPDFHAFFGGNNSLGAVNTNKAAIRFITDPVFNTFAARGIHKFLYVTSSGSPAGGHVDGTNGLISSGYVLGTDFDRADATSLVAALGDLGTKYDALIVASDFGGILTQAELDILNAHAADIINFLNQGGGIFAMAETVPGEGLAHTGFFGFLPFAVASSPLDLFESGNTLTPFGASLGLTAFDINGNFTHNIFTTTGGLSIVDKDPLGEILSLAGRGKVTPGGIGSVIITGQFTHFGQGTTQVSFGPGILVTTVTVADPTHLTAQIAIDEGATPGGRTVTVTSGNEVAQLPNGFTVLGPAQLITVDPKGGQQGQQNPNVSITGQFTHFAQGATVVSFGPGISVGTASVTDATHLTVSITIDAAAPIGSRSVTATTGAEIASLVNGFTVTAGTPVIAQVSPNLGQQGKQSLAVNITGQFSHWAQGATTANFGAGIGVTSLTVLSATTATAVISIDPAAVVGPRTITITTGGEVVSLANGFTVAPGTPVIAQVNPNAGQQSQHNLSVNLTGQFTHWVQSTTTASFGAGVTVASLTVTSLTTATVVLNIDEEAQVGPRTVAMTTNSEVATLANGFRVTQQAFAYVTHNYNNTVSVYRIDALNGSLTQIPGSPFATGTLPSTVSIHPSGRFAYVANFICNFGACSPPASVSGYTIAAAGALIPIPGSPFATGKGPWAVTVDPSGHFAYVPNYAENTLSAYTVNQTTGSLGAGVPGSPLPEATPLFPAADPSGRFIYVANSNADTVSAYAIDATTGALTEIPGSPYHVAPSSYPIRVTVHPSGRFVYVPNSNASNISGYSIDSKTGALSEIVGSPFASTPALAQGITFGGAGQFAYVANYFGKVSAYTVDGTTGALTMNIPGSPFAAGLGLRAIASDPSGQFVYVANFDSNTVSAYAIDLTTGALTPVPGSPFVVAQAPNFIATTLSNAAASGTPVLVSADPWTGRQGQQNLAVTINGLNTHFVPGNSQVSFGTGITVGSVTINSPTSAVAQIAIDAAATPGLRSVSVTTGAEVASLTNSFMVTNATAATPTIQSIVPASGMQGQQNLSVAITGQSTHFAPGNTTVSLGPGVIVSAVNVTDSSHLSAQISIDNASAIGARTITVTTDAEVASLANGFAVQAHGTGNLPPGVSAGPNQTIIEAFDALVSNYNGGSVLRYDGATGAPYPAFVPVGGGTHIPVVPLVGPDGLLYVLDQVEGPGDPIGKTGVVRYDGATGAFVDQFIPYGSGGLQDATGLAFGPDGNVYVFNYRTGQVMKYDGATGAFAGVFASGPTTPFNDPGALAFGPDGNLYVGFGNASAGQNILRFDGATGHLLGVFILGENRLFVFHGPYLYVNHWTSLSTFQLRRYDATTGAFVDALIPSGGSIPFPGGPAFAPDGTIWINEGNSGNPGDVLRFDGVTGAFINVIVPKFAGGLTIAPAGTTFLRRSRTTLYGTVGDDGLPAGQSLTVSWNQVSGPGTATFANPNASITPVDFSAPGIYVLRLTGSDSQLSTSSDVMITVAPASTAPGITSITPAAVRQGQTLSVTVGGQNTHWNAGTTQVDFGPGVAAAVTVSSPTSLTVQVTATTAAQIGSRTVSVTTGAEIVTLANLFNVLAASTPSLISSVPSTAEQGQASVLVTITGLNTHFVQGKTQLTFGSGVTVNTIAVASQTSLTAQLTIAAGAILRSRTLTVTTLGEIVSLADALTIVGSSTSPTLTVIAPSSGRQGQSGSITIVGQRTHFAQGATQVTMGPGIAVASVTAACETCLTVQVAVADDAPTGPHTVTVTTGSEVASSVGGFTVQAGTPILTSLSRASGQQGQTFGVTITGQFTHFSQGATQVTLGAGVTVSNIVVTNPTSLSGQLSIDPAAAPGVRTLTVTTGSEVASAANVFSVTAAATLTRIDLTPPGTVTLTKGQTFQFSARGTFSDNSVQDPLPGVTWTSDVPTVASVSGTGLATGVGAGTAHIRASKGAIASATTSFVVKPLPIGLFGPINAGATVVGGAVAEPGASVQVFVNGLPRGPTTVADGGGLWTVSGLAPALAVGDSVTAFQTVNGVTSDSSSPIIVTLGAPAILSVNPNTGTQGQQNLNVVIIGQATHFAQGVSQVVFAGTAITVNSVTVTSPTTLAANISIALNANAAPRFVTVTTGTEVVTLNSAFTVLPATNQSPTITIAPTWAVTLPNRLTVNYTVTDDGLPSGGALTVTWEKISGPGNVGFQGQTLSSISVGFDLAGTYGLRITATDTQFTVHQDITVTVTGVVAQQPTVSIGSPTEGTEVTSRINVIGSVASPALASWTLEFRMQTESTFRTLATGTTAVTNGVLGTLDPTLLLNGIGLIQLRATDVANQTSIAGPVSVVVTQNQKVGNFTVSFNDLTVPVAGLPIQVVRTYDSRNKAVGDFGVGWKLDISSVSVATNGALGDNWTGTVSGGFFPNYCIQAAKPHVVTITFSDGTVFQFQPTLNPACQQLAPLEQTAVSFVPISTTPPNVSLAVVGNNQPFVAGAFPGPIELLDLDDVTTFDPDRYQLTMPDGRVLVISKLHGLQSMADPNGNTLTITPAGITHSSGKSVTFQRDGSNRITQITDPAGNAIVYAYDANGDLVSVKDRGNNTTTFTYNTSHGLLTIVDPRGVQPIKNVYDDSGRLIQHIDAFGKTINYTHNLNARQEVVTDRLNNTTVNEYDANGNVVQVTDAMGGMTTRTYDARNNLLTETNPLGKTRTYTYDANNNRLSETDALGHRTQYTYNGGNQVLTITDALGHGTTNTYDAKENLTSTTDALGKTTTYTYNARGLRTAMTDPLGNVTAYEYDAAGNLTKQTDALGHVTTYTYDANGNRLTESKTQTTANGPRPVVTQYLYDAQNRLTKTTFADGGNTQTTYNSIGKQATTTDQLGRPTAYEYDLMGRLTKTTFPDGTTESATYDAEGNRITRTDRAGHPTGYTYDALKRLTQTTFADGATTGTTYDAGGEVTAVTDARGNVTHYAYDDAGRRLSVIDALTHVTTFAYDAVGNQTSMKDANGNVTQYQYDNVNRRLKTIYSDTTNDSVAYDALGRTVSKTDQAGKTTQFQYDKLGRLTAVVDALAQTTSYTYDEFGNRTSQTDANGHVTLFAYDALGRRVGRRLPLGMSESSTYNGVGNLTAKTDFNGKTTTYGYDLLNRLTLKVPDPTLGQPTIQFSYSATGQRTQMVDASGTTTYAYDLRDRLVTKATPQGTLTYTYDPAGDLASIRSSNVGGTSVNYSYDAMNRLATVTDNRLASGVTTYAYDDVGNLANFTYPNGVKHTYAYNTLNRLTSLALADQVSTTLASYGYTLGPTGNRTSVAEFGGRRVDYTYDSLYRLTVETITGGIGGTTTYAYDPVSNRLSRSSPTNGLNTYLYDANDRLTTDTYDDDGNTIASGANQFTYDFEDHLTGENSGALVIVYDGDGNRVAKTVGGTTTNYLVDDQTLTGHAQVLEELSGGIVQRTYAYGLNRISQHQQSGTSYYGYDGLNSVRLLIDPALGLTDGYQFDGFGNVISSVGTTSNSYLFRGEPYDSALGLYHLRMRYYNAITGRLWSMDPAESRAFSPVTLNKFVYANADPVNNSDPTGTTSISDTSLTVALLDSLSHSFFAPARLFERVLDHFISCGVNPITNQPGIIAAPTGILGQLRPGIGGDGAFGSRNGHHQGIDISAPVGTPVHANRAGTVTFSSEAPGYGNTVVIKHSPSAFTLYAHLQAPSTFGSGSSVQQGLEIGRAGRSGVPADQDPSEDHLHFGYKASEITVTHGEKFNDPVAYLNSVFCR